VGLKANEATGSATRSVAAGWPVAASQSLISPPLARLHWVLAVATRAPSGETARQETAASGAAAVARIRPVAASQILISLPDAVTRVFPSREPARTLTGALSSSTVRSAPPGRSRTSTAP